ncbi:unnamed protein product [Musa textilis]
MVSRSPVVSEARRAQHPDAVRGGRRRPEPGQLPDRYCWHRVRQRRRGRRAELVVPRGRTITSVDFATFGEPGGTCGAYVSGRCGSDEAVAILKDACLGRESCSIKISDKIGTSCAKLASPRKLVVQAMAVATTYRCSTRPSWLQAALSDIEQRVQSLAVNVPDDPESDSFAVRAENYYQKRPQLIALLHDLHHRYLYLADRYSQSLIRRHHRRASSVPSDLDAEDDPDLPDSASSDAESSLSPSSPCPPRPVREIRPPPRRAPTST